MVVPDKPKSVNESTTAAPEPAPSRYTTLTCPVVIVALAPNREILIDCEPVVAFSNVTLDTVLGAIVSVLVALKVADEVTLK